MSRIELKLNDYCSEIELNNLDKLLNAVENCGNDKLQILCEPSKIPQSIVAIIKEIHLIDSNKSLELIGEFETRLYKSKRVF